MKIGVEAIFHAKDSPQFFKHGMHSLQLFDKILAPLLLEIDDDLFQSDNHVPGFLGHLAVAKFDGSLWSHKEALRIVEVRESKWKTRRAILPVQGAVYQGG
jgi:hypothetical protein